MDRVGALPVVDSKKEMRVFILVSCNANKIFDYLFEPFLYATLRLNSCAKRNVLRRMVADNRAECLEACASNRRLSEESRQKKTWEEFLADLENNSDPSSTWRTIKSLSGTLSSTTFAEPLLHKGRTETFIIMDKSCWEVRSLQMCE